MSFRMVTSFDWIAFFFLMKSDLQNGLWDAIRLSEQIKRLRLIGEGLRDLETQQDFGVKQMM